MPAIPSSTGISGFKPLTASDLVSLKSLQQFATMLPDNPSILFQPKYDRVNYPALGTTVLNFFSTILGQSATLITGGAAAARNKTYRDTNMDQANFMSAKGYVMMGVALGYVPLGAYSVGTTGGAIQTFQDDKYRIASGSYLEIKFIDMPFYRIPLLGIPTPYEWRGTFMSTATNINAGGPGGYDTLPSLGKFDPPYYIAPGENFTCQIVSDGTALNTNNTLDLYLFLMGYEIRPAQ